MLGDDHGRAAGPEQAGDVGQRMRVMEVDDVRPLPGGGDVARRDLLAAEKARVTAERCRPGVPALPRLSTATTST